MAGQRKKRPVDITRLVLHESGYKCGNPTCRTILTLDIHHLVPVSKDGGNSPENLLPLCPNCHAQHERGIIPIESIRAWKMLLLTLNEGFDRKAIDLLLTLSNIGYHYVSGDGVLDCASLIAAGLARSRFGQYRGEGGGVTINDRISPIYTLSLTQKGRNLVEAWKRGDQRAAVKAITDSK